LVSSSQAVLATTGLKHLLEVIAAVKARPTPLPAKPHPDSPGAFKHGQLLLVLGVMFSASTF